MKKRGNKSPLLVGPTGWHWLAGWLFFTLPLTPSAQTTNPVLPNRCGVAEHERMLQQRNPDRLRQLNELNRLVKQAESQQRALRQSAADVIYRIPVVVHVIHNTASGAIGEAGGIDNVNISEEQIRSQIQVLNEDYRRQPGTNGYNTSPIGADAGIEFFLATTDPSGQPTTGITRHYYPQKETFNVFSDDVLLAQIASWPSDQYLNIWVTRVTSYLGYTQFPTMADTLRGLPSYAEAATDGSIIDYRYFGRQIGTVTQSTYNLGRTVTHEIGHWLGLLHPDGDTPCGDDFVVDTPPTDNLNQTVRCDDIYSNCSGKRTRELIENYLMYSPDRCMNMFTAGQVARMRTVLTLSPRRARLFQAVTPLAETEALTINVYPNPAATDPSVDVQLKGTQAFLVELLDASGRQLRATSYTASPSTRVSLSTYGLPRGIYVVRVRTDSERASRRLLIR